MRSARPVALCQALLLACTWVALAGPACTAEPPLPKAHVDLQADQLFRRDPLWIGGDGAYSIDLEDGRVLWLFGDSLIAKDASRDRRNSWFIRNSVGIQTGKDPRTAWMAFHWGEREGHPGSFFAERDQRWFWPGGAAKAGKGLLVTGQWLRQETPGMWGFGATGSGAFWVADASGSPGQWLLQDVAMPELGDGAILGTAVRKDEDYIYVYGTRGSFHDYVLIRFAVADAMEGRFDQPTCYTGGAWRAMGGFALPAERLFGSGAPESSVHRDDAVGPWIMIQSEGFGATTLAYRIATQPEGPWSEPRSFFRPPESFVEGAFVYAGKGHPELGGADLWVTYVPSAFDNPPVWDNPDGYFPHFVAVTW